MPSFILLYRVVYYQKLHLDFSMLLSAILILSDLKVRRAYNESIGERVSFCNETQPQFLAVCISVVTTSSKREVNGLRS